jgi:NAD(P)-dependent dehydrogenase (short-subunit alcohol dehydrogenase family)
VIENLFSVEGKAVVVTGGSRGVGFMIATGFVEAGARVYIAARKAAACDEAGAELSTKGTCISVPADVSTADGVAHLVGTVTASEPALHVLVNNAAVTWGAPIDEYPDSAWDRVLSTNVRSVFSLTREFLPALRAAATPDDPARVINIGSAEATAVSGSENYAYPASKAAVNMLSRSLAQRLARESITVNTIAPGPFDSKMMAYVLDVPETRAVIANSVPLGRIGRPDDVAGAALYLASRAGAYLTGAVIPVDGGVASITPMTRG